MTAILCLDFDGVVHDGDLTSALFDEFADGDALRHLHERREAGMLTIEEYIAGALGRIDAEPDAIAAFVQERARPAAGLLELADWAHWHGWQMAVVSTTPDLCVHPVLDAAGVDRMARHCGRSTFRYRWSLRYRSPRGIDLRERFVMAYLRSMRETADLVVYVTADATNREAAHVAHAVFAGPALYGTLAMEHPLARAFETLDAVRAILEREGEAWHESCSSTTAAAGS